MLYIAPYAATAMGEFFRDSGRHALVMYDDLSKHAMAYREISLLLRRPPGASISRRCLLSALAAFGTLLEDEQGKGRRLAHRAASHRDAGGRRFGLHSDQCHFDYRRTDFLETDLFNSGVRPAVNVGLSVSRVGFSAAIKAVKQVGATLKLDLAQYRELAAFAQFGSDLDPLTQKQLNRGSRLTELLKQPQFQPLTWQQQVVALFAGTQGYLGRFPDQDIRAFEVGLYKYFDSAQTALVEDLTKKKALDDDLRAKLHAALKEYAANFKADLAAKERLRRQPLQQQARRKLFQRKRQEVRKTMANVLDLRRRIRSVKNTRQITKAMKMSRRRSSVARRSGRWRRGPTPK